MTTYVTPKKNTAYKFFVGLVDQANTKLLKANPTIASGDFKVSIDGGALANLTTLPSVSPAAGRSVMIDLSASEMNGDNIVVKCIDAAGAEWCDLMVALQTTARQIDDLAYPATSGRSMVVDAAGLVDATVVKVGPTGAGTAQTARDIGANVLLSTGTGSGQLDFTSGVVKANVTQLLSTAWLTPGVAGTPDVNTKLLGGTAQTGRDVGTSVLLSSGTGTGQVSLTSGTVDVGKVAGSAAAATDLSRAVLGNVIGTVGSSSTTTSIVTSSLDPAATVADQYKGRIITFDRATSTTNLRGQASDITANTSGGILTVTALTDAPTSGDTFTIT